MYRKITEKYKEWKDRSDGRTALLVEGARRVGKSYSVTAFARENYRSFLLINFDRAGSEIKSLFDDYIDDLDMLFAKLCSYYNVKLYERESVIIFDEIQFCPRARSAIKYLVEDGRYDYMETGSLISIHKNTRNILIPSEEEKIQLYPMDFEEFLLALDQKNILELIGQCYEKKIPMGQALHRKAMDLFRQYMIVGGMPQVVERYVETRDFNDIDRIKRNILSLYREDIQKHGENYELTTEAIFDEIPVRLREINKKFFFSAIKDGAREIDLRRPLFWLSDAFLINNCYNTTEPNVGLKRNMERLSFKSYFLDTGLLISHSLDENGIVSEEIYKKIMFDKLSINQGMFMENVVAQMIVASGRKLYYYACSSRDNVDDRMEIDFLIQKKSVTDKHNISAIEVKSGQRYTLSSLNKYRKKYADYIDKIYVLHTKDYDIKDGIIYLPLYMMGLMLSHQGHCYE